MRTLVEEGITIMQATPATWQALIQVGWKGDGRLKVLVGGEAVPRKLADDLVDPSAKSGTCTADRDHDLVTVTVWSAARRCQHRSSDRKRPAISSTPISTRRRSAFPASCISAATASPAGIATSRTAPLRSSPNRSVTPPVTV